jgi:uncharacterized protein YjbI with pentapeptide repeats
MTDEMSLHNTMLMKNMLDIFIDNIRSIDRFLSGFQKRFFQGADFFKKELSGGSFNEDDLRGCDFRESVLKNVYFSSVKCGLSFVRLFLLAGCFLFSWYASSDPKVLLQGSIASTSFEGQSEIMESLMLKPFSILGFTVFKSLSIFLLAFSISYWMGSFSLFKALESKAKEREITTKGRFINDFMNSSFIFKLYPPAFGIAVASTSILFLGTDNTRDIIRLILHSSDEYQKEIASYIFMFQILGWLLTACISLYLPALFSTSKRLLTTSFEKSIMSNIDFSNAFADKVNFKYSKMISVNFTGASLKFANFHGSYLEEVNFENADLTYCNFTDSNIENLKEANFKNAILDGAYYKKGDMIYHISTISGFAN